MGTSHATGLRFVSAICATLSRLKRSFPLLIAVLLWANAAAAAYDSVMMRGLTADKAYSTDGVETVDTYGGGLMAAIPIGPQYKTNGTLAYRFTLSYNSKAWDYQDHDNDAKILRVTEFRKADGQVKGVESIPSAGTNAGLGWRLLIGGDANFIRSDSGNHRLSFTTPDGAEHLFYTNLHDPSPSSSPEPHSGPGPFYTRDGSYLRMRKVGPIADGLHGARREIDFPDGTIYGVQCISHCNTSLAEWHVTDIRDPVGGRLTVEFGPVVQGNQRPTPPSGVGQVTSWVWTVKEWFQTTEIRSHEIEFALRRRDGATASGNLPGHDIEMYVREVRLAPVISGSGRSTYGFEYIHPLLYREERSSWPNAATQLIPFAFRTVAGQKQGFIDVALLRRVTLPSISTPDGPMSAGKWEFRYWGDNVDGSFPVTPDSRGPDASGSDFIWYRAAETGLLAELIYPSGRGSRIEYDLNRHGYATCILYRERPPEEVLSVRRRSMTRQDGAQRSIVPRSTWIYLTQTPLHFNPWPCGGVTPPFGPPREAMATVVEPEGKVTVTFHSVFQDGRVAPDPRWSNKDRGLPFSYMETDDGTVTGMPVSQHVYDCSSWNPASSIDLEGDLRRIVERYRNAGEVATCGANNALPLRLRYVEYDYSPNCDPEYNVCIQVNSRVKRAKEIFWDVCDATGCKRAATPRYILTTKGDFDGYGHYRRTTTTSDIPREIGGNAGYDDRRVEVTGFNPVWPTRTYRTYRPATRDIDVPIGAAEPWILNTYDRTERRENGLRFGARYVFDDRGLLTEQRTLKETPADTGGDTQSDIATHATDLRVTYTHTFSSTGAQVDEKYFGGDAGAGNDGQAQFHIRRQSKLGTTASVDYRHCSTGALALNVYSAVVDPVSGFPTSVSDARRRSYGYGYDALGRVTSISPAALNDVDERPINFTYPPLVAGQVSYVQTSRTDSEVGTDSARSFATDVFESFARSGRTDLVLVEETETSSKRASEPGRSARRYLPIGWLRAETTVGPTIASAGVTDHLYDVFGRVVKTTPPKNSESIEYTHAGTWYVRTTTNGIARHPSDGSTWTAQHKDAFGRLIQVSDFSDAADGAIVPTRYQYNAADKLVNVDMGNLQQRRFGYDGRGLMTFERIPELKKKTAAGGYQQWEYQYQYDARGNVRRRLLRRCDNTVCSPDALTLRFVKPTFNDFDLQYTWSSAELLMSVEVAGEADAAGPRLLKRFTYSGALVTTAERVNYVVSPEATNVPVTWSVKTDYGWNAIGQLTSRTLRSGFSATVAYDYNRFELPSTITYPGLRVDCETTVCPTVGSGRVVSFGYTNGLLNTVSNASQTIVTGIDYHANRMWAEISRNTRSTDRQEVLEDTYMLPRPSKIETVGKWGGNLPITYDGAGNVKRIGPASGAVERSRYYYDGVMRLKQANLVQGGGLPARNQFYNYDRYGNLTGISADGTNNFSVEPRNNRLDAGATYDDGGNLTSWRDPRRSTHQLLFWYDATNRATRSEYKDAAGRLQYGRVFLYDADDERVAVVNYAAPPETIVNPSGVSSITERWSLRGAGNEVLSDFLVERIAGQKVWRWNRDTVHMLGHPAVEFTPTAGGGETMLDLHWDHLGSIRCVTAGTGGCAPYRQYLPFGEEAAQQVSDGSRLRYTGHERDDDGTTNQYGDVDYMHARYYLATMGRFLSVDPVAGSSGSPQSWNRYSYVLNRPMTMIDPTGRIASAARSNERDASGEPDSDRFLGQDRTVCDDFGCRTFVIAPKDPHAPDVNATQRSTATQIGLDVLDLGITGQEGFMTAIMGFLNGLAVGDFSAASVAGMAMDGNAEYERKLGFVDTTRWQFKLGYLDGVATSIFAARYGTSKTPPPATPPAGRPTPAPTSKPHPNEGLGDYEPWEGFPSNWPGGRPF